MSAARAPRRDGLLHVTAYHHSSICITAVLQWHHRGITVVLRRLFRLYAYLLSLAGGVFPPRLPQLLSQSLAAAIRHTTSKDHSGIAAVTYYQHPLVKKYLSTNLTALSPLYEVSTAAVRAWIEPANGSAYEVSESPLLNISVAGSIRVQPQHRHSR